MSTLTKYNALVGELEPYTPSALTIQKALIDEGVTDPSSEYSSADKLTIAKAALGILKKMIVLSSDSLGKSSQSYNVEMLQKRLQDICAENDLDVLDYVEVPTIDDGSDRW